MKIEYEPGDKVFASAEYGGKVLTVLAVHKLGVTVSNWEGETFFLGKRQVEPHPDTVIWATWGSNPSTDTSHKGIPTED